MSVAKEPIGDRIYRGLLRLLPFDFRSEFGSEMEETFREQRQEFERERNPAALRRMWWSTIADLFRMAPREHVSVLAQDTRYAFRMMAKNPGYTVAAALILGLGIGANTAIFSVVDSVLLKPLPYLQGDRLVMVRQAVPARGVPDTFFSVSEINDYRTQSRSLAGLVEYHNMTFTLLGREEAYRVQTGVVSPEFFDFFGVKPLLGRTFVADDDKPGALAVLVLSYEFWKRFEHGDPQIVGKVFQMNDRPHTVIGVLPPIPQYPDENDVYMPVSACPFRSRPQFIAGRQNRMMSVFARVKPGMTAEHCKSDMSTIAARLMQDYPEAYPKESGYHAVVTPLRDDLTSRAKPLLLVLLGAAAFVLLIACANVANLILARMARREHELMIRTAVGAGSGRLLRQLLTESLILALAAATAGLVFAYGSLHLLTDFASQLTPRAREISMNGRVLAFAILCASATAVIFGSVAALYSRHDVAAGLKEGSRAVTDRGRRLVRGMLITAQVAFSFVLLIGAGLMARSLTLMSRVEPGFVPQRVFAMGMSLNFTKFNSVEKVRSVGLRILSGLQELPGVMSASLSSSFPMDRENAAGPGQLPRIRVEGDPTPDSEAPQIGSIRAASPDYFKTLGIPLIAGRSFRDGDHEEAPRVVIISRSLARKRWPKDDPIGKRISFIGGNPAWAEIVGVVGDVKEFGLSQDAPFQVYRPQRQTPSPRIALLRVAGDLPGAAAQARRVVRNVDPDIAVTRVETLEQARADSMSSPRTLTRLFSLFAVLALVIAVSGIGCMLALWVRQRIHEIGIRVALGAQPLDIVGIVIRQGMALVVVGIVLGIGGAVAVTRLIKTLLFQVTTTDIVTYAAVSALLLGAAMLACYLPARRAARIDPLVALRCD